MAQMIDEQAYEDAMSALEKFAKDVGEACAAMTDAAQECVDNCEEDQASKNSQKKVLECVKAFWASVQSAEDLRKKMGDQLEAAREAARKADSI